MNPLLVLAAAIDKLTRGVGLFARWLILLAVLISAGNAIMRKAFSVSSNGMLEIQWYLFSAVFLLAAGYTLLRNAHVRVDFVSSKLTPRARAIIDILGLLFVIGPFCLLVIWLSWPLVTGAWASGESSPDAGGLIRWPVYALVPAGMLLLLLQSISELIKRAAFLAGVPGYEEVDPDREGTDGSQIQAVVDLTTPDNKA